MTPPSAASGEETICSVIVENDASEGGEGIIRCNRGGEFSDDRTSWTCSGGHTIDKPNPHCVVGQCPCRLLASPPSAEELEVIVEAMAESAHNAWWQTYLDQGYASRLAAWGEEFMVPFDALSQRGQEFDRMIMRAILQRLAAEGFSVARALSIDVTEAR